MQQPTSSLLESSPDMGNTGSGSLNYDGTGARSPPVLAQRTQRRTLLLGNVPPCGPDFFNMMKTKCKEIVDGDRSSVISDIETKVRGKALVQPGVAVERLTVKAQPISTAVGQPVEVTVEGHENEPPLQSAADVSVTFELDRMAKGGFRWPCSAAIFSALALSTLYYAGHEVLLSATTEDRGNVKLSFHKRDNTECEHHEIILREDFAWEKSGEPIGKAVPEKVKTFIRQNFPSPDAIVRHRACASEYSVECPQKDEVWQPGYQAPPPRTVVPTESCSLARSKDVHESSRSNRLDITPYNAGRFDRPGRTAMQGVTLPKNRRSQLTGH
ncbi:hypothetical protein BDZ89DRAFT_1047848 [Hymenopellis radicata]|nr:hypothetical protein BDZ89DRAFT_1047848 [Hymenopellis radicata]